MSRDFPALSDDVQTIARQHEPTPEAEMKKTTRQTAAQVYATRRQEIAAMIEFLKCELDAHAGRAAADGMHWGHVGDLEQIRGNLKETLVFVMGGRDEEATGRMIESAIADALA